MPRKKKSEGVSIEHMFSKDYQHMLSMVQIENKKVKKIEPSFVVCPEYDIWNKLRNMILSETERYTCFEELRSSGDAEADDPLHFHTNSKYLWQDYMYQIPGIYEVLGIKRDYSVAYVKEVIQNPILFLILIDNRIEYMHDNHYQCGGLYDEIINLAKVVLAIKDRTKGHNNFTNDQIGLCSCFLFGENIFGGLQMKKDWMFHSDYKMLPSEEDECIENAIHAGVEHFFNTYQDQTETVDRKYHQDKGQSIGFPKYVRSILLGIYEYHEYLPLNLHIKKKKHTLWHTPKGVCLGGVDKKLGDSFFDIVKYMQYKRKMEEFYNCFEDEQIYIQKMEEEAEEEAKDLLEQIHEPFEKLKILGNKRDAEPIEEYVEIFKYKRKIDDFIDDVRMPIENILEEVGESFQNDQYKSQADEYKIVFGQNFDDNKYLKKIKKIKAYLLDNANDKYEVKEIENLIADLPDADQYKQQCEKLIEKYCKVHRSFPGMVDSFLQGFYTVCLGTLHKVFSEEKKYKEAALYSFERLYSLYLFKLETDMFYEKLCSVKDIRYKDSGNSIKEIEELRLNRVKDAVKHSFYSVSDVLWDIYCSPGVYHRVLLAKYIIDRDLSINDFEPDYDKDESESKRLRKKIEEINRRYFIEEGCCLNRLLDAHSNILEIHTIDNECETWTQKCEHRMFYDKLQDEVLDYRNDYDGRNKFNAAKAKSAAKKLLQREEFQSSAYKYIHFWVIFSSFFSKNNEWVKLNASVGGQERG